mmetsp:Transcript_70669/g.86700  ORF Transcript_70669/g.86700 Transcript_70669/m.86700 type:complete len:226 (-) Transcript_70669:29-706(-)
MGYGNDIHCAIPTILDPPECSYYMLPTLQPSIAPTLTPSSVTYTPTLTPSKLSLSPTKVPTKTPTHGPTENTITPTIKPSHSPTINPTSIPSSTPTKRPELFAVINTNTQRKQRRNRVIIILCCSLALSVVILFGVCLLSKLMIISSKSSLNNAEIELNEHIPRNSPTEDVELNEGNMDPDHGIHITTKGGPQIVNPGLPEQASIERNGIELLYAPQNINKFQDP